MGIYVNRERRKTIEYLRAMVAKRERSHAKRSALRRRLVVLVARELATEVRRKGCV